MELHGSLDVVVLLLVVVHSLNLRYHFLQSLEVLVEHGLLARPVAVDEVADVSV